MKIPRRTNLADSMSRAEQFAKDDAIIKKSLADINTAAAHRADGELPEGYLDFIGLPEFLKTRGQSFGIKLTDEDETGFRVLEFYLANGGVVSRKTLLEVLTAFNPARQLAGKLKA